MHHSFERWQEFRWLVNQALERLVIVALERCESTKKRLSVRDMVNTITSSSLSA